jgi:hypothetical protein
VDEVPKQPELVIRHLNVHQGVSTPTGSTIEEAVAATAAC